MGLTATIGASRRVERGQQETIVHFADESLAFTRSFRNDGTLDSLRAQVRAVAAQYEAADRFRNELVEGVTLDLTAPVSASLTAEEMLNVQFLGQLGRIRALRAIDPTHPLIAALATKLKTMLQARPGLLDLVGGGEQ